MANTKKKRSYSRPYMEQNIKVNSHFAVLAMENYINRTMSSLYALDVILFYIADEEIARQANQKVNKLLNEKLEFCNNKIEQMNDTIEKGGFMPISGYTGSMAKDYLIYSPLGLKYLDLILKFDQIAMLTHTLWFHDELSVDSSQNKKSLSKCHYHLKNISDSINNATRRAMVIAKNQGKEEEVLEAVKAVGAEEAFEPETVLNDTTFGDGSDPDLETTEMKEKIA
jgi:hypothetical protein